MAKTSTAPRVVQSTGEREGRVSRRILNVNAEQPIIVAPHFELVSCPNDHNVQVLIRMRPLSNMEKISQGYARCLKQESLQTLTWLGHPEVRYTFDHIVCETITQEKLFRVAGLPMVDNCMSGYNSCMFAYGQTGTGKTYTMMGEINKRDGKLVDDCGITPRLFEYLFSRIKLEEEKRREERLKYSCKCSFLEIYNEHITDLLEPSSTNLQLREDLKEGVYVENLTQYNVNTVDEVLKLLLQGAANRKVAGTDMNSESSRSHSVFTCIVESRWEKDSVTHLRFGRLNLVDLAGSERQRSSGAGERQKEASYINKSLSTLGLVIMSLVDVANGKQRHVPYRDSRLTFLLQDSLGGNSKTTIIANVSPSMCAANETLSTLKFAQRAKLIQNNAKVNEDASGDVIALQRQIQMLKEQLSISMTRQTISNPLFQAGPNFQNNQLAPPREDVQRTKLLLRFRENKIKRLELLANGVISTDKYLLDENNALREEIQQLQARSDKNQEVTRFQGCYERGEREALLAEVLELHDQLLKALEVEESYIEQNFPTEREKEDDKSAKELEEYKCANSKLIRKVDKLNRELSKYMSSQTAVYPVETVSSSTNLGDQMGACDQVEEKLNSLRTATIALTEIQYTEQDASTKEAYLLSSNSHDKTDMIDSQDKFVSKEYQIITELVTINEKLDNMKDHLSSIHDQAIFEELNGSATDVSSSSSILYDDEDVVEKQTSALVSRGSKYSSSKQESENGHLFLKNQMTMAYEAFIRLDAQLSAVFKDKDVKALQNPEMREDEAGCLTARKFVEEKACKTSRFFSKFEEAEADNVLNALLRANEKAKMLSGRWKHAAEEVMAEKASITDDLKRVSSERDELCEQINYLQGMLEMAYAVADENEAIAVEACQARKIYAEQKEEEYKILKQSVEELESAINVLEKNVNEMKTLITLLCTINRMGMGPKRGLDE